jgi:hypothetical protein
VIAEELRRRRRRINLLRSVRDHLGRCQLLRRSRGSFQLRSFGEIALYIGNKLLVILLASWGVIFQRLVSGSGRGNGDGEFVEFM